MLDLYDHIQELRAELANNIDPVERAQIARELDAAYAEQAARAEVAFGDGYEDLAAEAIERAEAAGLI